MYWFLICVGLIALAYFILVKPFQFWRHKGVPQLSLAKLWKYNILSILQLRSQVDVITDIYNSFSGKRYGGAYQFLNPALFLRDPDLIKQITVKDFDHFIDHKQIITEEMDPLLGRNLFALKGDIWKDMRATLSPSFTSSKMRAMFGLMTECAEQFVRFFQNENKRTVSVEFKDAFTRYTNDVIASTAFGVSCDSLKDRENEFYMMGKKATTFKGFWKNFRFILILACPQLCKMFEIRMFDEKVREFFRRLVKTNIESREKNGIVRPDMIHLLMEARKGRLKHEEQSIGVVDTGFAVLEESAIGKEEKRQKRQLSDDDITAQALIFFFAGFETISTLMCFVVYELAVNPDIQQTLRDEVDETLQKCNGSLTYEALLKMNYLDMVISETLRKWPTAVAVDRVCVKPYTIEPTRTGEKPVYLKEGDMLVLPMWGIHRDKQFYPEPDRFDPERFSDQNKDSINPYTYIPFGVGPRSCIGNRFALLEAKTMIFYILSKFEIVVVKESTVPIRLAKNQLNLAAEKGFWFGLKPRSNAP